MKTVIIGYGWVGQANALALKIMGYEVYYYDPQVPALHYVEKYQLVYDQIKPLASPLEQDSPETYYIVCVGDRVNESGEQDISLIKKALASLEQVKGMVVLRSTILPDNLKQLKFDFYLPEFLHEKKAVEECLVPHFFVIGEWTTDSKQPSFFKQWGRRAHKTFRGTPEEAAYIKYLSNIWNALRIAFVNEFGDLIKTPITLQDVSQNKKIIDFVLDGGAYVRYGRAFSGHCLPKDISAFVRFCRDKGLLTPIITGAKESNHHHEVLQQTHKILPEWYSEWELPEISTITSLKILTRIGYRKTRDILKIFKKNFR